jgi:hypothetical protein
MWRRAFEIFEQKPLEQKPHIDLKLKLVLERTFEIKVIPSLARTHSLRLWIQTNKNIYRMCTYGRW